MQREAEIALEYRVVDGELRPYFDEHEIGVMARSSSRTVGSSVRSSTMRDWEEDISFEERILQEARMREIEHMRIEADIALESRIVQGEWRTHFDEEEIPVMERSGSRTDGSSVQGSTAPSASCAPGKSAPGTPPRRTDFSSSAASSTPRKRRRGPSSVMGGAAESVSMY